MTLPKTIDNDLWGTEVTFGFQSAIDIAATVIDSIHSTAFSHSRVFIVEVMGHKAGWLTLYAGIASGADVIIVIPEIPYSAKKPSRKAIDKRAQSGKRFSILAVAEGAISQEEAKMSKKEFKAAREKDALSVHLLPHGGRAQGAHRARDPRDHSGPLSARRRAQPGRPPADQPLSAWPRRISSARRSTAIWSRCRTTSIVPVPLSTRWRASSKPSRPTAKSCARRAPSACPWATERRNDKRTCCGTSFCSAQAVSQNGGSDFG